MSPVTGAAPSTSAIHRRAPLFLAALLVLSVAFGTLAFLAYSVLYFPIDLTLAREVQSWQQPWLVALFGAVSWIGFPPQSNLEFGLIILGLALVGRRWEAAMALFAAAGSAGLWFLIAPLVQRPRPSPDLVRVAQVIPWGSFPSGHVLNLTAFFGFLFFLAWTLARPSPLRAVALLVCGGLVVLIGPARVYSGQHWPSDVLGGYLLGGLWLAITIHLYHWGRHRLDRRRGPGPRADALGQPPPQQVQAVGHVAPLAAVDGSLLRRHRPPGVDPTEPIADPVVDVLDRQPVP